MKKKELRSKSSNNFNYQGDIKIQLTDGDRVFDTINCHNTGCATLFRFFTACLSGDFTGAKNSRPCRLVLFKMVDGEVANVFDPTYWTESQKVSTQVLYDRYAVSKLDTNGTCSITYHFRVPFLALANGASIKKIGLYPNNISNYADNICAYHYLDKEIEIPVSGGNFTVIIDWTLTITNQVNN